MLDGFSGTVAKSNAERVLRYARTRLHGDPSGGRSRRPTARSTAPPGGPPADEARIPTGQMFAIWDRLARELRAPDLPIAIAHDFELEDLDLLGFVVLTAPTLAESIQSFVRYASLLNDGRRWEIHEDRRRIQLRLLEFHPRVLGVRLSHETAIAQVVRAVRRLSPEGGALDPAVVRFAHAAPRDLAAHHAHFRCPIEFDAACDSVEFDRSPFAEAPPNANARLWSFLRGQADQARKRVAPRPLLDQVRDEIAHALRQGETPAMGTVVQNLGTTERTLRRALADHQIGFRKLADEARRNRVWELLAAAGAGELTRVAFDAGFADPSALTHACRRWFGCAPRDLIRPPAGS